MSQILLTTINATYSQTSLGLRYIFANLGEFKEKAQIIEFTSASRVQEMAEDILKQSPEIVGISIYIWNFTQSIELVKLLKSINPSLIIVGGGPELRCELSQIDNCFDHIIIGEGEIEFPRLCQSILVEQSGTDKIITAQEVTLSEIVSPYDDYSDHDIKTRRIMVESSRGCPFGCHFCLSSLDQKVRRFDTDKFLFEMEKLWNRGARDFKFIDRTFNLDIRSITRIMDFFYQYAEAGLFLHFEIVPDHIDEKLFSLLERFPPGVIQFEVGVQTFNLEVSKRIGRNQDYSKIKANILRLMNMSNIHLHTDLIVGLPGEDIESFGKGLDELMTLSPHEIQIGILKRLKGAPIDMHSVPFEMKYRSDPPYEILSNIDLDFFQIQELRRFARFWDLYYNSGNFKKSISKMWENRSVFETFNEFSHWIYQQTKQTHQISLERLSKLLCQYRPDLIELVREDYMSVNGRTLPPFLNDDQKTTSSRKRQQRHSS